MFSVWLVFTSNLNTGSQTSWLKVKFKLVNFNPCNITKPTYFSNNYPKVASCKLCQ